MIAYPDVRVVDWEPGHVHLERDGRRYVVTEHELLEALVEDARRPVNRLLDRKLREAESRRVENEKMDDGGGRVT